MCVRGMIIVSLVYIMIVVHVKCSISDKTSDVFQGVPPNGIVAAFGDFNADKATDIFVLSENGKSLFILEANIDIRQEGTTFINKSFITGSNEDALIVNVVPGDFNNDSQMDVLVMRTAGNETYPTATTVEIHFRNGTKGNHILPVKEIFRDQPVVIDGNGDMSPDIFGETLDGRRVLCIFQSNYSCSGVFFANKGVTFAPLKIPQSSAFLDLNGDLSADLCVVTEISGKVSFEFWLNVNGNLTNVYSISAPTQLKIVGQASFVDLDGNHDMNIILPGCLDVDCHEGAVFVWSSRIDSPAGIWSMLNVNFKRDQDNVYSFPKKKNGSWPELPITLRIGDFNLDGYPDAVGVLSDKKESYVSFLLYNVECTVECQNFSRTFSIDYSQQLHKYKPAVATFFDLMENGVLDVLLTENDQDGKLIIRAMQQDFTGDASFLKVLVVSGMCHKSCPEGHSPYGVNQVGPTARFESTTPTGTDQIGIAAQLSQSSYFSLQLPFMLFGLGQTPNFVDTLQVGIPYPAFTTPRNHSWSSIIPNSQVIVIPYPVEDPENWKHELYVTPSRLVMLTGVSLLGTCTFIAAIVGLLHWKERVEDKKEKLQGAQHFHFDAM